MSAIGEAAAWSAGIGTAAGLVLWAVPEAARGPLLYGWVGVAGALVGLAWALAWAEASRGRRGAGR